MPIAVDPYVEQAALWTRTPSGEDELVAEAGSLTLDALVQAGIEAGGQPRALSVVHTGRSSKDHDTLLNQMKTHEGRERLVGGHRLAAAGVLSRLADLGVRLSLLFRGSIPGGSAARSSKIQRARMHPDTPTYYGHVVHEGGYIVCQYWFFYAFNDWRSGFGGVNEHEADWEQATIFLDGTGELDDRGFPAPRWVAYSAHEETGDDLRRRWDDPDLSLVDGCHPVVFSGAGSHSGAYLPGDYLITVQSPTLAKVLGPLKGLFHLLTPWRATDSGLGIPYVDYARGDGLGIGPGEGTEWNPVVIGDDTGWVVDYHGLWGRDTGDRLGGERGPAGPRYEREGTVRDAWGDPVGWAGLNKVPPGRNLDPAALDARIEAIDTELASLTERIDASRDELRTRVAGLGPDAAASEEVADEDKQLLAVSRRAVELADERKTAERVREHGMVEVGPHAHLTHRNTPIEPAELARERVLGVWAVISTPIVLLMVGWLFAPIGTDRVYVALAAITLAFGLEALARGYLLAFVWRVLLMGIVLVGGYYLFVDWRFVIAGVLGVLAVLMLVINVVAALRR